MSPSTQTTQDNLSASGSVKGLSIPTPLSGQCQLAAFLDPRDWAEPIVVLLKLPYIPDRIILSRHW